MRIFPSDSGYLLAHRGESVLKVDCARKLSFSGTTESKWCSCCVFPMIDRTLFHMKTFSVSCYSTSKITSSEVFSRCDMIAERLRIYRLLFLSKQMGNTGCHKVIYHLEAIFCISPSQLRFLWFSPSIHSVKSYIAVLFSYLLAQSFSQR